MTKETQQEQKYIDLTAEFVDFEDRDVRITHAFRKPSPQELSRANKQVQKEPERAFRNLLLALIKPEQADAFRARVEEYPGVATAMANEIYKRMGYDSLGK